jgi:pyridoxal phosphate enzyme (YggS family)
MIEDNIELIRARIETVCNKVKRDPAEVTLIAVTKTVSAEDVNQALAAGVRHIAESRIQEAQQKFPLLKPLPDMVKHMIGHLQTNKAARTVEMFDLIQSVDTLNLAEKIATHAVKMGKVQDCLIEVKVSGESTKFGLVPEQIDAVCAELQKLSGIRIRGMMAMAPFTEDPEQARPWFRMAHGIFERIQESAMFPDFSMLSMGMSHDFEVAIEEGSTMVRIGTAIFGERNYTQ